jgi:hypothetical protein
MQNFSVQKVKEMTQDQNLIKAATAVFQAMAYEQTVREVIAPKQKEVIDFFKFKVAPDNLDLCDFETITRYEDLYLVSTEDIQIYIKEMDLFHREKGFKKPSPDHCPLLIAESLTRDTKEVFVDLLEPFTGLSFHQLICAGLNKAYKPYIDLNLSLFAPLVKIN